MGTLAVAVLIVGFVLMLLAARERSERRARRMGRKLDAIIDELGIGAGLIEAKRAVDEIADDGM